MRKYLVVLVAVLALVAFTAPPAGAAADIKASGFYRAYAILSNFHDGGGGPSLRTGNDGDAEQTNAYVAQRFRVKWQFGSENVKATWYLESDVIWGDSAGNTNDGAGRNFGGALGADKVQTETKQINVWFKIPDTSLETTVGIHTVRDSYSGVFGAANDAAGVTITGKFEPVSYKLVFAKLYENDTHHSDDGTLYQAEVNFAPTKDSTLGLNFYVLQDDTGAAGDPAQARLQLNAFGNVNDYKGLLYMPGIDGSIKVGPAKISGWFLYQFGTYDAANGVGPTGTNQDLDVAGFAANLRGEMKVGPGKAFLEGLYISGDDNENDTDFDSIITLGDFQQNASPGGYSGYTKTHMVMMLSTWNMASISQCVIGCSGGELGDSLSNSGRGIWHVAAGYSQKFTDMLSGEMNVGYVAATELYGFDKDGGRDNPMGTEINATVTAEIQKGLKISLTGAYAFLGDFMRDLPANPGVDPNMDAFEDAWTSYVRVNYTY